MGSSLSHLEAQRKYAKTHKGLATRRRYRKTEKAKLTRKKYLVGKARGEAAIAVYYWKDSKFLLGRAPTRGEFVQGYGRLPLKLDDLWEGSVKGTLERVFTHLNRERGGLTNKAMQEWIAKNLKPHPHTSMSIGDMVEIRRDGKTELWLCGLYDWVNLMEKWQA